jgi:hypothetical protein
MLANVTWTKEVNKDALVCPSLQMMVIHNLLTFVLLIGVWVL